MATSTGRINPILPGRDTCNPRRHAGPFQAISINEANSKEWNPRSRHLSEVFRVGEVGRWIEKNSFEDTERLVNSLCIVKKNE